MALNFRGPVMTTMHKRKAQSDRDAIAGELSITITACADEPGGVRRLEASAWLRDREGRQQYLLLGHEVLVAMKKAVDQMTAEFPIAPGTIEIRR